MNTEGEHSTGSNYVHNKIQLCTQQEVNMQEAITAIESCKYELRWLQVGMFACMCITLSVEVPTHYCYREYLPDKGTTK